EFTTLIKELLDESTEPTSSSLIKPTPEKDNWSSPSLKTLPTKSTHSISAASRTSSSLSTTSIRSFPKHHTESTPDSTVVTTTTEEMITSLDPAVIATSADKMITSTHSDYGKGGEEEEYEDEKEEDYHDEKPENVSVEVVPIQAVDRQSSKEVTEGPRMSTTTTRRLFSDDSWEQPPPNFGYSSMRYPYVTLALQILVEL
ncbi:unnamed protein product, partial [Cylicostephanus goldi]